MIEIPITWVPPTQGAMLLLLFALSEVLEACVKMGFWCCGLMICPNRFVSPTFWGIWHEFKPNRKGEVQMLHEIASNVPQMFLSNRQLLHQPRDMLGKFRKGWWFFQILPRYMGPSWGLVLLVGPRHATWRSLDRVSYPTVVVYLTTWNSMNPLADTSMEALHNNMSSKMVNRLEHWTWKSETIQRNMLLYSERLNSNNNSRFFSKSRV